MKRYLIVFIHCLLICPLSYASHQTLDAYIIKKMKQYHVPGASIAIIDNSEVSYQNAYGYADLKTKRHMTTDTYLQACSISKIPSALAILMALSNNHLSINDPANNFLTSWKIPENKYTKKHPVTVATLLNHSAGIINPYEKFYIKSGDNYPTNHELLSGTGPANNPPLTAKYKPGSKYEYCNGCYVILQQVLVDVEKKPFPNIVSSMILSPLKMSHSTFDTNLPYDHYNQIALPYDPNGKLYNALPFLHSKNKARYANIDSGLAGGGLWSTPSDLAKLAIAMQQSLAGNKDSYLPPAISEKMVAPSSTDTRGLGVFISNKYGDETKGGQYFSHGGFNQGYLAILVAGKSNGKGVIIMINTSPDYHTKKVHQWEFIKEVEKYIADAGHWN